MFHNDIDQSIVLVVAIVAVLFALPFVMAWLEKSIRDDPSRRGRT